MLIIALSAGVVALNAPPPTNMARVEADRFAARVNAASEAAVLNGSLIGLELTEAGYKFFQYERGEWRPAENARLRGGVFPADIAIAFEAPESARRNEDTDEPKRTDETPAPTVFFSPTGETTALEVNFRARRKHITLLLDNAGELKVMRNDRSE